MQAASGLVVAALFVLLVLPPLLALFGPKLFWPSSPRRREDLTTTGAWHRVADWVSGHAGRVAAASIIGLAVLATGVIGTDRPVADRPVPGQGRLGYRFQTWPTTSPAVRPIRPG